MKLEVGMSDEEKHKEIEETIKKLGEKLNETFKLMVESKKYYYPKIHEDLLEKEDKEIEEVLDIELLGQCDNWLQKRDVNIKYDFELNPYILEAINRNFKGLYHKQCELIKAVNELKKGK